MSYSVLRKGKVVMSNFSNTRDAQKYIDEQCKGLFGGIDESKRREFEIKDDGGCYLTTAAVSYKGLPDNCFELTTLRNFRDNYLKKTKNGTEEIQHYYATAPLIVDKINKSPLKTTLLEDIYDNLISPCVKLIESKKYQEAHKKYKQYTLNLEKKLLMK